jgi:hypothetical protein
MAVGSLTVHEEKRQDKSGAPCGGEMDKWAEKARDRYRNGVGAVPGGALRLAMSTDWLPLSVAYKEARTASSWLAEPSFSFLCAMKSA